METNVIAFPVNLRKNQNSYNSGYRKYYAETDTREPLKDECTFQAAYVVESKRKTINGKEVTYQEKIPISSYAAATAQTTNGEGGGNGN